MSLKVNVILKAKHSKANSCKGCVGRDAGVVTCTALNNLAREQGASLVNCDSASIVYKIARVHVCPE